MSNKRSDNPGESPVSEHHRLAKRQDLGALPSLPSVAASAAAAAIVVDNTISEEGYQVFLCGENNATTLSAEQHNEEEAKLMVHAERLRTARVKQISFTAVGDEPHHVLSHILTTGGHVKQWGPSCRWNSVPHQDRVLCKTKDSSLSIIPDPQQCIQQISSGYWHYAAVGMDGSLWTWGKGTLGELGHGNRDSDNVPKRVEALLGTYIVQVSCGAGFTVALSNEGKVYTFGSNASGMTGLGVSEGEQTTPRLVESLQHKNIIQVDACNYHAVVVSKDGQCFSFGRGTDGRLGHEDTRNKLVPTQVCGDLEGKRVTQAACGFFHTAVITSDKQLYTFGSNREGQLGHNNDTDLHVPKQVLSLQDIAVSQVSCGGDFTVILTEQGDVYSWGNGSDYQLGHPRQENVMAPKKLAKLEGYDVESVAAFTSHIVALVKPNSLAPNDTSLCSMLDDEEFSDVTFEVEGLPIRAHRNILALRSEVFRAMFRSGMREAEERVIQITDTKREIFINLMKYLYDGAVDVQEAAAIELYSLADKYRVTHLQVLCRRSLETSLSSENVGPLLQMASDSGYEALKETCMNYVVEHFSDVSDSSGIERVSHALLIEIMRKASKVNASEASD